MSAMDLEQPQAPTPPTSFPHRPTDVLIDAMGRRAPTPRIVVKGASVQLLAAPEMGAAGGGVAGDATAACVGAAMPATLTFGLQASGHAVLTLVTADGTEARATVGPYLNWARAGPHTFVLGADVSAAGKGGAQGSGGRARGRGGSPQNEVSSAASGGAGADAVGGRGESPPSDSGGSGSDDTGGTGSGGSGGGSSGGGQWRTYVVALPHSDEASKLADAVETYRAKHPHSSTGGMLRGRYGGPGGGSSSDLARSAARGAGPGAMDLMLPHDHRHDAASRFDAKTDASSAELYFHYYGQLLHQQNMLQDMVRTSTYYAAILENHVDFNGKVVVDVGSGTGILSFFAVQAGARKVYAIEASDMAEYSRHLVAGNSVYRERIEIIHGKVEEVEIPEVADVLVSEPMGTLLVNERMLESYIIARKRFLRDGGKMYPTLGRIHAAPFSDEYLYAEVLNRAVFWQQSNYYGVDMESLYDKATASYLTQPVIDSFDPSILLATPVSHVIDFASSAEEDLHDILIPLHYTSASVGRCHGLACWFDVLFNGSNASRWLSTAPGLPTTHWHQIRLLLPTPLVVVPGQVISGTLRLVAHPRQSYDIYVTLGIEPAPGTVSPVLPGQSFVCTGKLDLKEPYYRISHGVSTPSTTMYAMRDNKAEPQSVPDPSLGVLGQGANPVGLPHVTGRVPPPFSMPPPAHHPMSVRPRIFPEH